MLLYSLFDVFTFANVNDLSMGIHKVINTDELFWNLIFVDIDFTKLHLNPYLEPQIAQFLHCLLEC